MTYQQKLLDPRWQRRRLEILERDGFICRLCKDPHTTLHIHHLIYRKIEPWEYEDDELITYCKHCHSIAEYYKKTHPNILINRVEKIEQSEFDIKLIMIGNDSKGDFACDIFKYENNYVIYLMSMDCFGLYRIYDIYKRTFASKIEDAEN